MTATRTETDSFGPLEVPADKYWGAQTQRSLVISKSAMKPCPYRLFARWASSKWQQPRPICSLTIWTPKPAKRL